jgi:hypothetical protein
LCKINGLFQGAGKRSPLKRNDYFERRPHLSPFRFGLETRQSMLSPTQFVQLLKEGRSKVKATPEPGSLPLPQAPRMQADFFEVAAFL